MSKSSALEQFVQAFRATVATCPDKRRGKNTHYSLVDAALGAFAVFSHLASLLATFNILAFLLHTLLDLLDAKYRLVRQTLVSRQTFFDDLRALTRYICFASWTHLLDFMLHGIEVALPPNSG